MSDEISFKSFSKSPDRSPNFTQMTLGFKKTPSPLKSPSPLKTPRMASAKIRKVKGTPGYMFNNKAPAHNLKIERQKIQMMSPKIR